jgi:hypothetical protein
VSFWLLLVSQRPKEGEGEEEEEEEEEEEQGCCCCCSPGVFCGGV